MRIDLIAKLLGSDKIADNDFIGYLDDDVNKPVYIDDIIPKDHKVKLDNCSELICTASDITVNYLDCSSKLGSP